MSDRKLETISRPSAVVLSSGRATYEGQHVSRLIRAALDAAQEPQRPSVEAVAHACAERLHVAARETTPSTLNAQLLVVGYGGDISPVEAYRVDVPPRDFGDGLSSVRPERIDPEVPVVANPCETDTGGLVLAEFNVHNDLIDEGGDGAFSAGAPYRFAGLPLEELRPAATERIREWFRTNAEIARREGVGGLWTVAEVRPGETPHVEYGVELS
ncbi:hypothetical protein [Aeromicrobium choanae]|uniref:hypothetical protein n=1 Tax=Aeromicrobium choanae TaxID=1736691 RepID=UPI0012948247|nr:hypothetical protein [Aeromicrobium choanae]